MNIDPQTYYRAAGTCQQMAQDVSEQLGVLRQALSNSGSMAGSYSEGASWGNNYDAHSKDFFDTTEKVANALINFSDILKVAGHNWDLSNYNANRDPAKGPEPVCPALSNGLLYEESGPDAPSSVGDNGDGLKTNVGGLLEKIGIPVPNGDKDKLSAAGTAWKAFADHDAVSKGADGLQKITDSFSEISAPDAARITEHLGTLKSGMEFLASGSSAVTAPITDHHNALDELRSSIDSDCSKLKLELAGTVAVVAVAVILTTVVTGGAGLAGADEAEVGVGATTAAELIAEAATAIRTTITGSRLLTVLGGAAAAFAANASGGMYSALQHIAMLSVQQLPGDESVPTQDKAASGSPAVQSRGDAEHILDENSSPVKEKKSIIKEKPGGNAQAEQDFNRVTEGLEVKEYPNGVKVAELPDGSSVTLRGSSDGRETVSIQQRGSAPTKYRYNE